MSGLQWTVLIMGSLFALIIAYDLLQKKKPILRNFPLIGHLRYLLIEIGLSCDSTSWRTTARRRPSTA